MAEGRLPDGAREAMKPLLQSCAFRLAARLALGGTFVYASLQKIADPAAFAENISNFHMVPQSLMWSLNLCAIYLPWLELIAGLFLIVGFWIRGSSLILSSMLAFFIVAIGQAVARGIKLHCGCFSAHGAPPEYGEMYLHIAGNLVLLGLGIALFQPRAEAAES